MSKIFVFLFLFHIILSKNVSPHSYEHDHHNLFSEEDDAILSEIHSLFQDVNAQINNDFLTQLEIIQENTGYSIPSCQLTIKEQIYAHMFNVSNEILKIKYFDNQSVAIEFIKNLALTYHSVPSLQNQENYYMNKFSNSINLNGFKEEIWTKADLVYSLNNRLHSLTIFFKRFNKIDKYVIVYYQSKSNIKWCKGFFIFRNLSEDILYNFAIEIYNDESGEVSYYQDLLISYFSLLSYIKIHKSVENPPIFEIPFQKINIDK
jgi:hypothetical protein